MVKGRCDGCADEDALSAKIVRAFVDEQVAGMQFLGITTGMWSLKWGLSERLDSFGYGVTRLSF